MNKLPAGWQAKTVKDVCTLQNGNGFKPCEWSDTGLPIIRIQNLNGSKDFNYFSGKPKPSWLISTGEILFAWAGTKGVSFGPFIWKGPQGVLNQHIFRTTPNDAVDRDWFYYSLKQLTFEIEGKAHGFKATLLHVSKGDIEGQKLPVPPRNEQVQIAKVLSTWDKAIATTERLLANSQQQKDMLTNQLLTGQQRFSEFVTSKDYQQTFHGPIPRDWSYVPITDIANQQSKANSTQADLPVLSCSKYDGLVDSLKYFKKKVYSDDTSKYRVVEFGDFAYPSNHIEEGSIGYQDVYPAGIVSPIYTVFRTTDAVDDYFLYRTLKTDKYRQIFSAATSASVDRRGSLRWKEFSKIQVPLPPLPEQQKIAQVLSTADAELSNLQTQLAKLKLEKKALMQQLLTGQRRVKLDADAAA